MVHTDLGPAWFYCITRAINEDGTSYYRSFGEFIDASRYDFCFSWRMGKLSYSLKLKESDPIAPFDHIKSYILLVMT